MRKITKRIPFYITVFLLSSSMLIAASEITPAMRNNAEKVIKSCEKTYQNVKNLRARFDKVKKPTIFTSRKKKDLYKNLEVNKKVYDLRFAEFANFTNGKIQIRTAKRTKELRDAVSAYSSNCARFAAGIEGFVEWATTGKESKGFEIIYKSWQDEARSK